MLHRYVDVIIFKKSGLMSVCLMHPVLSMYVLNIWCYVSMFKMFGVMSVCLKCLVLCLHV